jgi:hypothetical protein
MELTFQVPELHLHSFPVTVTQEVRAAPISKAML